MRYETPSVSQMGSKFHPRWFFYLSFLCLDMHGLIPSVVRGNFLIRIICWNGMIWAESGKCVEHAKSLIRSTPFKFHGAGFNCARSIVTLARPPTPDVASCRLLGRSMRRGFISRARHWILDKDLVYCRKMEKKTLIQSTPFKFHGAGFNKDQGGYGMNSNQ